MSRIARHWYVHRKAEPEPKPLGWLFWLGFIITVIGGAAFSKAAAEDVPFDGWVMTIGFIFACIGVVLIHRGEKS